ncbi:NFRKB winged helix-like domain [Trinorchestia longiramus]|nr:NFRKB winged helix-like domain [Trinorchestia longiramus]
MELEEVECCGVRLQLPRDVCWDFSLLAEIISPETWNNCLTEENREELMNYLPTFPENDLEEKTRTLEMFFMDVNFRYGTPLRQFHRLLQSGYFNPSIARQRRRKEAINRKIWRYQYSDYLRVTLEETIVRRQHYIDLAMTLGPGSKPPRLLDMPMNLNRMSVMGSQAGAGDTQSSGSWQASIDVRTKRKYFRELVGARAEAGLSAELSDDEHYPEGGGALLNKKQRRLLCSAESSLPLKLLPIRHTHSSGSFARDLELVMTSNYNPLELTDANFEDLMAQYIYNKRTKRKNGEYCAWSDTTGITLTDIIWRICESSKRMPHGLSSSLTTNTKPPLKTRARKDRVPGEGGSQGWSAVCGIKTEEPDGEQEEDSGSSVVDSSQNGDKLSSLARYVSLGSGEVKKESCPGDADVKSRKRAIKTGTLLPGKRRALDQAGREAEVVAANGTTVKEEPPDEDQLPGGDSTLVTSRHVSQLQPPLSWLQVLPAAVCFLAGFTSELQPTEFVPYIEYKETAQAYQWIGAGRDADAKLQTLYHHWINNRSSWSDGWLPKREDQTHVSLLRGELVEEEGEEDDSEESIPLPRFPTTWVVQPASEEEKTLFRSQEKLRYERPHKGFTYRVHGYEAVVGPVKGIYSQHSGPNKARGHSLLTPNRPAYVTILALVRDAVARLPNGEGTRAEICELLRESQYVAPLHTPAAESALNSVVSGALDRLHYEQDPCVKYLANKKLWVYLHRNRDEKEFERMHHLHGPGTPKSKKVAVRRHARPKTPSREATKPLLNAAPPNVSLDPLNTSAKVEGGQVKMLPEDILVKREISTKVLSGGVHSSISNTILRNINNNSVSDRNSSGNSSSFSVGSVRSTAALAGINAVVGPQVSYTAGSVQHTLLSTGHNAFLNTSFASTTLSSTPTLNTSVSTVPSTSSVSPFAVKGVLVKSTSSSAPATVVSVSSALLPSATQDAASLDTFATTSHAGSPVFSLATSTPTTTVLKVGGNGMRTLMSGNLQTIQVSTASGIQTIRVALPSAAIAKNAVVNRVSEATGAVSATAAGKRLPQQLGQLIQTSSGTHFIAAGGGRGGLSIAQLSQVAAAAKRSAGVGGTQQPAILRLNSSLPVSSSLGGASTQPESAVVTSVSHLPVSGGGSTAIVSSSPRVSVRPLVTSGSGSSAVISSHNLTTSRTSHPIVYRGEVAAVRSVSHVGPSTSTATAPVAVNAGARLQSIAPQQLAGLKLVQGTSHLQPGVGQKLVVSGNKVLLQGGKVMQGGVQQLVTLHQQKPPLATGLNSSLQNVTLVPQSSTVTTGASQQRLIVANVNASGSSNKGGCGVGNLISIGNKLILAAQNTTQGSGGGGQVLLSGDKLGQVLLNGDKIAGQVLNIGGQQVLVAAPSSSSSNAAQQQQIVLPASVLQSGHISIKGLQGFHTLKVMPSVSSNSTAVSTISHTSSMEGRTTKPVVARVLQQAPVRPSVSQQASFSNQTLVSSVLGAAADGNRTSQGMSSRLAASLQHAGPAQHAVKQIPKTAEQPTLSVPLTHVDQKLINVNNFSSNSSSYRNSQKPS